MTTVIQIVQVVKVIRLMEQRKEPNKVEQNVHACPSLIVIGSATIIKLMVDSSKKKITIKVGAQGFEPRPAGIFCSATVLLCVRLVAGNSRVGLPVDHHLSERTTRHSRATGASYTTRLYYTPFVNHKQNHCLA